MKSIAFVTESEKFNALITQFRRTGVSALKLGNQADLTKYEVIVLDLGYPFEGAYLLLNRLRNESCFSEQVVLAAISDKSQLKKLRSIALGCDAYISPKIEYRELYNKIKELQDPSNFLVSASFEQVPVEIEVNGSITHISETGCLVHSKIGLNSHVEAFEQSYPSSNLLTNKPSREDPESREDPILIESSLLQSFGVKSTHLMLENRPLPLSSRFFLNEVIFDDLEESTRSSLRKIIHGWRIQ